MFLRQILDRLGEVEISDAPDSEQEEGDVEVGVLSEELQRLYVLWRLTHEKGRAASYKHEQAQLREKYDQGSSNEIADSARELHVLNIETLLIKEIFWSEVKLEHPELLAEGGGGCGIGKEWKVVRLPVPEDGDDGDGLSSLLRILSGSGVRRAAWPIS